MCIHIHRMHCVVVMTQLITLALRRECEGIAFGSVCLSVRAHISNTIAPIDLICLHKKEYTRDSVLL